jgi:hypothetical protein
MRHCGNCRSRDVVIATDYVQCSDCGARTYIDGEVVPHDDSTNVTTTKSSKKKDS